MNDTATHTQGDRQEAALRCFEASLARPFAGIDDAADLFAALHHEREQASEQASDTEPALFARIVDAAPRWRALWGVEDGDHADLFLSGYLVAQLPSWRFLLAVVARNLFKVVCECVDRHDDCVAAFVEGWLAGRRGPKLISLAPAMLSDGSLETVRERLGITHADVARAQQVTSDPLSRTRDEPLADRADLARIFRGLVLRPYGDAFASSDALRAATMSPRRELMFIERVCFQPVVQARLARMPRLDTPIAELARLAAGTLGRGYADHMIANNLVTMPMVDDGAPDIRRYLAQHLVETHDVWHVVTGAGTDVVGEIGLHAVYNGQLQPMPVTLAFLARCILKTALFDAPRAGDHIEAIVRGWLLGKRAQPMLAIDWRALFPMPLAAVRDQLAIPADGVRGVVLA